MDSKLLENNEESPIECEYNKIDQLYDECIQYLEQVTTLNKYKSGKFTLLDQEDDYNEVEDNQSQDEESTEVKVDINEINGKSKDYVTEKEGNNIEKIAKQGTSKVDQDIDIEDPLYDTIKEDDDDEGKISDNSIFFDENSVCKVENEVKQPKVASIFHEYKSERLRRLSEQLPKIIVTQSSTSLSKNTNLVNVPVKSKSIVPIFEPTAVTYNGNAPKVQTYRYRSPYVAFPKRLVSKHGAENVALISNVPFEKLRLLNDTFHTLINLRWRWIVTGTVVVHFTIWLVFAVFWYIASLAHYDFEPDPPHNVCITGGKDFVTIFLASVEAQTTIGFGDRTIDEECPESIFLFIMQLILGTGLSGVLTCVVYAKLTRPEKLSRDGVGFSKKAVICMRDGHLCLMFRAWDLNHDHIICSDFNAHFVKTYRTKEGECIRYYARTLEMQQRQFLLWPVTMVHVIDENSPLYRMTPENFISYSYEITVSLKGASASMGTFTQSQTSYLPRELFWGYRFPSVVRYDNRKQKYVIDHKKLDFIEQIDTPLCSAMQLYRSIKDSGSETASLNPGSPSSFSDKVSTFRLERSSSFKRRNRESKA